MKDRRAIRAAIIAWGYWTKAKSERDLAGMKQAAIAVVRQRAIYREAGMFIDEVERFLADAD